MKKEKINIEENSVRYEVKNQVGVGRGINQKLLKALHNVPMRPEWVSFGDRPSAPRSNRFSISKRRKKGTSASATV